MSLLHDSPRRPMALLLLVAFLLLLVLPACEGSPSVLAPASPEAKKISDLFWQVAAVAALIFLVVESLLIIAIIRFRNRPGASEARQFHGHFTLELAWTILPAIIVTGIFVATVATMTAVTARQPDALRVKVTGFQWWWQIEYPDLGIVTATDLHVPVGQPVAVELHGGDVIHSFWAGELFGKTDTIPGHTNWVLFTAERPGTYHGQCAEFCGLQHANMGFLVIAEPREAFDAWARGASSTPDVPSTEEAAEGARAFVSFCGGCHTVQGTQAQGRVGPDLTHFGSRRTIASLTLENTPENLAVWLANPPSNKPGVKMPNLNLNRDVIEELVEYLSGLK